MFIIKYLLHLVEIHVIIKMIIIYKDDFICSNFLNSLTCCLEMGNVGDYDHFSLHCITCRLDELL